MFIVQVILNVLNIYIYVCVCVCVTVCRYIYIYIYLQCIIHLFSKRYACGDALIWDQWSQLVEPMASRVPYMVGVGNHEYVHAEPSATAGGVDISGVAGPSFRPGWADYRDDSFGECALPVVARFDGSGGPQPPPLASASRSVLSSLNAIASGSGNKVFWYSFDYGMIHFTILSSEHDWQAGSLQHDWAVADLAAVDRKKTPWLVVQLHRPMYSSEPSNAPGHVSVLARRALLRCSLFTVSFFFFLILTIASKLLLPTLCVC